MDNTTAGLLAKKKVGEAALDIEEVFSTYLYKGTSGSQSFTTGIDLVGNDGMIWIKNRTGAYDAHILDTLRGNGTVLSPNSPGAEGTGWDSHHDFTSDGFSVGLTNNNVNNSSHDYAAWTFRKAPRFFDVVTYTGTGSSLVVPHNLGVAPGMIIVKNRTAASENWWIYHKDLATNYELRFTSGAAINVGLFSSVNDSSFTLPVGYSGTNVISEEFVAYLFADDPLGPSGDGSDGLIACGSYTGTGTTDQSINLGWEPQYVMIKNADVSNSWIIFDVLRGVATNGTGEYLIADGTAAETAFTTNYLDMTPTGFDLKSGSTRVNGSGNTMIYMAIRRPMKTPTSATDVFAIDDGNNTEPAFRATFPVDMALERHRTVVEAMEISSRLTNGTKLATSSTAAEATDANHVFDYMNGWRASTLNADWHSWMWKRAKGFFDVVTYTGDGIAGRTVDHNLGVVPEMIWIKRRDNSVGHWLVQNSAITATNYLFLSSASATAALSTAWNDTEPDADQFTLGTYAPVNASGSDIIAYLFASLPGISKVGSFTGNGTSQTIDCGFTAGARFVMIKSVTDTGNWLFWDSVRGIVAGDESHLAFNSNAAQITTNDSIDTDNSGFIVNLDAGAVALDQININAKEYIYYAIS